MYILPTFGAVGWQHTGIWRLHYMYILLLLGLQLATYRDFEAALHVYSSTFRAAGWQPTGF